MKTTTKLIKDLQLNDLGGPRPWFPLPNTDQMVSIRFDYELDKYKKNYGHLEIEISIDERGTFFYVVPDFEEGRRIACERKAKQLKAWGTTE